MYPFDLKIAGATRAEMLALKTMMLVNVCACSDVMISHGWPAKLPRRCSFFLSVLSFLFSFSFFFFTMLLALSIFLLRRTNVELKKL